MSFHWSDSYPFRACASHASQRPSGDGFGDASSPGLPGVKLRGAPPCTGIVQRSPFVLQASRCAGFALTITSAPSGVKAMSSPPPTRKVGQSESPGVTSRAGPPCAGWTNTCVRLPSFHSVQWRAKRWSTMRASILLALRSSNRFRLQASTAAVSPAHPG